MGIVEHEYNVEETADALRFLSASIHKELD